MNNIVQELREAKFNAWPSREEAPAGFPIQEIHVNDEVVFIPVDEAGRIHEWIVSKAIK